MVASRRCEDVGSPCPAGDMRTGFLRAVNTVSLKCSFFNQPFDPATLLLGIHPKIMDSLDTKILISTIFIAVKKISDKMIMKIL